MDFKSISAYIEKYRALGEGERNLKKELKAVLEDMGCLISFEHATLSGREVKIKAHPALKHYITLNKERILSELQKRGFASVRGVS